jgi:hypothetical protein
MQFATGNSEINNHVSNFKESTTIRPYRKAWPEKHILSREKESFISKYQTGGSFSTPTSKIAASTQRCADTPAD